MIEYFGREQLNELFLFLMVMTAPGWLAMIILPRQRIVKFLATPFVLPVLYLPILGYMVMQFHDSSLLPAAPTGTDFKSVKGMMVHPMAILILVCKIQICFLAIGTTIYQKAVQLKTVAPVELIIAWFTGPLALLVFAMRLLVFGRGLWR
jgi:hypothetical protein